MMATEARSSSLLRRVICALLGFVLPEFGIPWGFHTLWHSNRVAGVSCLLQRDKLATDCVIRIAKPPLRSIEAINLAAPKSP